jgi:hypothetical protein
MIFSFSHLRISRIHRTIFVSKSKRIRKMKKQKCVAVPLEELKWMADMIGGCHATMASYAMDVEHGISNPAIDLTDAQQCEAELEYMQAALQARIKDHRRRKEPAPAFSLVGGLVSFLEQREPWKSHPLS